MVQSQDNVLLMKNGIPLKQLQKLLNNGKEPIGDLFAFSIKIKKT